METNQIILQLRKQLGLSQDEFAEKLFVTRQAVSRWETGETVPGTDSLKLMGKTFGVSVDYLLGHPSEICQSCAVPLNDKTRGTNADGSLSNDYCEFCFANGDFAQNLTLPQMAEHNLRDLDEWNQASGSDFSAEQAREMLLRFLSTLKRWRTE